MDFSNLSRQNENPTMIFTLKMTNNDEFLFLVVVVLIVVIGDLFASFFYFFTFVSNVRNVNNVYPQLAKCERLFHDVFILVISFDFCVTCVFIFC